MTHKPNPGFPDQRYNLDHAADHAALVEAVSRGDLPLGRHRLNVQIQTTSVCNAKCQFCPYVGSWHEKNPGLMTDEVYAAILDGLAGFRIRKFCPYLENEPLADPRLFARIEQARRVLRPEWVEVSTNAALLDAGRLAQLLAVLEGQQHEIWISFHGADRQSYESIMGLDYTRVLSNIHLLLAASQRVPLNIIIRGAGQPKVDKARSWEWFAEDAYQKFWQEQLAEYQIKPKISFFRYHDRADSPGLRQKGLSFGLKGRNLEGFYCTRLDRWAHFLYTGEPILCCMDYVRETAFGGRVPERSVPELYALESYLRMLRQATGVDESPADFICKRCGSPGG